MKTTYFLLAATLLAAVSSAQAQTYTGSIHLPTLKCSVNQGQPNERGIAIYKSGFSSGDPAKDQFVGYYYNDANPSADSGELRCVRHLQSRIQWECGKEDPREGSQSLVVSKAGRKSLAEYYSKDPVESLNGPDDTIVCK